MSIYYLLINEEQIPNHHTPGISQNILPYLFGGLAFLLFVCYCNSAVSVNVEANRREAERFEFSEATYEEKVIYLMTQMRWWDYYRGLWVMHFVINTSIACQNRDWSYTFSVTNIVVGIVYNLIMSLLFVSAEIQLPSVWAMLTGGHKST
ncbi:hypothetical protein NW768_005323 [Fusarium equiseti]|uniref:Uncharacterized protein n=1 Tax=Fusarium equiseti TaxID=61235 RepID=A0ABQ8REY1_FUSEQ|nr:hypothetical protein NW768_005323 [Fusarium equiseti]